MGAIPSQTGRFGPVIVGPRIRQISKRQPAEACGALLLGPAEGLDAQVDQDAAISVNRKYLRDEAFFPTGKRRTTGATVDVTISGFRPSLGFDQVIKHFATRAVGNALPRPLLVMIPIVPDGHTKQRQSLRSSSGRFATLCTIRPASSRASRFAAGRPPGSSSGTHSGALGRRDASR
jgi:hypothetical protein